MAAVSDAPFDPDSPLWAGLEPTPQPETSEPLCPILYAPAFAQAMGLFRTLVARGELSQRALALTGHLSRVASSNFTVWAFRFKLLCADPLDPPPPEAAHDPFLPSSPPTVEARLAAELQELDESCRAHLKQYQVWQHRKNVVNELSRRVASRLGPSLAQPATTARTQSAALWTKLAENELDLTASVLSQDAKNYHTWIHRQWALMFFGHRPRPSAAPRATPSLAPSSTPTPASAKQDPKHDALTVTISLLQSLAAPGLWEAELVFADNMITADLFNNSAWNHRYFVQFIAGQIFRSDNIVGAIYGELTYTKNKIAITKNNASSWAYLRGVFAQLEKATTHLITSGDADQLAFATSKAHLAPQVRDQLDTFAARLSPSDEDIETSPDADSGGNGTPDALEWRLDSIEARLTQHAAGTAVTGWDPRLDSDQVEAFCTQARQLLMRLTVADPIRTRYWLDKRATFTPSNFTLSPAVQEERH